MLSKALALFLIVGLYFAIQLFAYSAGLQNPWGAPRSWVEHGSWLYRSVHHLTQMLLALLAIGVLGRWRFGRWGLNLHDWRRSLRLVAKFAGWFAAFILIGFAIQLASGMPSVYKRPLSADHIIGHLAFIWLISGVSEEILFRGMMQTWLSRFFSSSVRLVGVEVPMSGFITAIIFALVQVNFRVTPFEIVHLSVPQLVLSFVLGIFYAVAYHRTGSLLAPALAHNVANGLMGSSNILLAALQRG